VGLLDALGYDADTADDGIDALEVYGERHYDAVLMDVQMPRLDGYAATRALRERETGGRVPVLAMTAAAVEGERERCLEAGMDDFLTKPVDPDALAATLAAWLSDRPAPAAPAAPAPVREPVAGLDLERLDMLRDMSPGETTYLDRAIGNFVVNTPGQLEEIRSAVLAEDAETLRAAAHKLAGSASNLGVVEVASAARALELADSPGGHEDLVEALGRALDEGRDALLGYQAAYAAGGAEAAPGA